MYRWLLTLLTLPILAAGGAAYFAVSVVQEVCPEGCAQLAAIEEYAPAEASIVYAADGSQLGMFYTENRLSIPLDLVPAGVIQTFLLVEDRRFWSHSGVDGLRIGGALLANLREGRVAEGSSTITMQLVRNLAPDLVPPTEKTLRRKIVEAYIARRMERSLSKEAILERYLNTIYLGAGAYGIEMASRIYFGKRAADLTRSEAALLAGLPKAPSRYNPYANPGPARERRDVILSILRSAGRISAQEYAEAIQEPIRLAYESEAAARDAESATTNYIMGAVRRVLQPTLGGDLARGGYRIHTTIRADLQTKAEVALEDHLSRIEGGEFGAFQGRTRAEWRSMSDREHAPDYLQGAIVVLDAQTGGILAMVGGREFSESPFNRVTQAHRQPGSVFKPFVFAAALEQGYGPNHPIADTQIWVETETGEMWAPRDHGKSRSGFVTLTEALVRSRNRPTVRLAEMIGLSEVVKVAQQMGLEGPMPEVPSLSLGSAEVRMVDLAAAYLPIARIDGSRAEPYLVSLVTDQSGDTVYESAPVPYPAIEARTSYALRGMLREAVDRGTGYPARQSGLQGPAFGKTGTTTDATDLWFVGGTPGYVGAVWIGFDTPRSVMPGGDATGGRIAAPLWSVVMDSLSTGGDWSEPENVAGFEPWRTVPLPDSLAPVDSLPGTPARRDHERLCVRPRRADDSGVVSFLVPCSSLEGEPSDLGREPKGGLG